jgi:hypothetical protein
MYGAEVKIDGAAAERKPFAATLASYSFSSISTPSFLRRVRAHLKACIDVLQATIQPSLLEYISEAGCSDDYAATSDEAPSRFETDTTKFGPNETGELGHTDQFKAKMISIPNKGIHKFDYSYRVTTYTAALSSTEFGSEDKIVTVLTGSHRRAQVSRSVTHPKWRTQIARFIYWLNQPF